MLKADFHTHTSEDPHDTGFAYDARMLIKRAAALGYDVLAITNHDQVVHTSQLGRYARKQGLLLVPGCEATIHGKHVLLYNVTERERKRLHSFADLAALRAKRGKTLLTVAAHPCYPSNNALGALLLRRHADLFDAIEISGFHWSWIDYNKQAVQLAKALDKSLVASSDAHSFRYFGRCHTLVHAEQQTQHVLDALRNGQVILHSPHLPFLDFVDFAGKIVNMRVRGLFGLSEDLAF